MMWWIYTPQKNLRKPSTSSCASDNLNWIDVYHVFKLFTFFILCWFTTFSFTIRHCRRIAFCLDVHNEAVKSMRYPPDAYKKELALGDKDRKDEKTIEELIKELEDEYEE